MSQEDYSKGDASLDDASEEAAVVSAVDQPSDASELLRRAVFAEEALELSRFVPDKELLRKLRDVVAGKTEMELREKLGILKEVLAQIKENKDAVPAEEGIKEIIAEEVRRNIKRISSASEPIDVGTGRAEEGPGSERGLAARLRRLAESRGIIIR